MVFDWVLKNETIMGTIYVFLVTPSHWIVCIFVLQIPESHPFQMEICFSFHQEQTNAIGTERNQRSIAKIVVWIKI